MSGSSSSECARIVRVLNGHYGYIPWWPGDTDEVLIGAVLTQQTRWENVVRALALLKERSLCSVAALYEADPAEIENAIRCTGFYRVKTRRLKALATFVIEEYGGIWTDGRVPDRDYSGRDSSGYPGSVKRPQTVSYATVFTGRVSLLMPIHTVFAGVPGSRNRSPG